MTEEQFKSWYGQVNELDLEDAAYEGLVSGRAEIERLKALITELADALGLFLGSPSSTKQDQQYRGLLQRAREAAR